MDPELIEIQPEIDRGDLLLDPSPNGNYLRYADTESGISPRVPPGIEGFVHVVATDEHDEDGVIISDEFTHLTSGVGVWRSGLGSSRASPPIALPRPWRVPRMPK